ncbi:hypothetical protein N9L38_00680 [Candidatus Poseidoniales archaeon]|nr:hypothetical protein [Candidatus Poseidoniales archaeon]
MGRLTTNEVVDLVRVKLFPDAIPSDGNWITIPVLEKYQRIFFSQCKPSSASKGHWNYDFFHTIPVKRVEQIVDSGGKLVLINYVDKEYCLLSASELIWLCTYSSREKSNQGRVIDIVINFDEEKTGYFLRPYDRMGKERRLVEVEKYE